eukprot:1804014-Rhodomonas_salina.3
MVCTGCGDSTVVPGADGQPSIAKDADEVSGLTMPSACRTATTLVSMCIQRKPFRSITCENQGPGVPKGLKRPRSRSECKTDDRRIREKNVSHPISEHQPVARQQSAPRENKSVRQVPNHVGKADDALQTVRTNAIESRAVELFRPPAICFQDPKTIVSVCKGWRSDPASPAAGAVSEFRVRGQGSGFRVWCVSSNRQPMLQSIVFRVYLQGTGTFPDELNSP